MSIHPLPNLSILSATFRHSLLIAFVSVVLEIIRSVSCLIVCLHWVRSRLQVSDSWLQICSWVCSQEIFSSWAQFCLLERYIKQRICSRKTSLVVLSMLPSSNSWLTGLYLMNYCSFCSVIPTDSENSVSHHLLLLRFCTEYLSRESAFFIMFLFSSTIFAKFSIDFSSSRFLSVSVLFCSLRLCSYLPVSSFVSASSFLRLCTCNFKFAHSHTYSSVCTAASIPLFLFGLLLIFFAPLNRSPADVLKCWVWL